MAGPISAAESMFDGILTYTVNLMRVDAGQRARVLSMLEALENRLAGDVQNAAGKSAFTQARLGALLKQTKATIAGCYRDVAADQAEAMGKVAKASAAHVVNLQNGILKVPIATVGHSEQQLVAMAGKTLVNGRYPKEWWAGQSKALQDRFAQEMRLGMLQGEPIDKLVQRVRGTKALHYTDGIMQASRAQAEALVRTSVIAVANESRIATIMANPALNKGIQWVATLDARTTPICRALDGLTWSDPDLQPQGHNKAFPGPTAHWQCRSAQIPVTKSWEELSRVKLNTEGKQAKYEEILRAKLEKAGMKPEVIEQQIAAQAGRFDGKGVPGTLTTADWLKGKSDAEIDAALGAGRGALYRQGKITLQQLTDQNNRPLSLRELQQIASGTAAPVRPAPEGLAKPLPKFASAEAETAYLEANRVKLQGGLTTADMHAAFGMAPADLKRHLLGPVEAAGMKIEDFRMSCGRTPDGQTIAVSFYHDNKLLKILRTFVLNEKQVGHDLFEVAESIQAKGLSKAMFAKQLELYDHMGIRTVGVHANIDVGAYAWARYGFLPDAEGWKTLREEIRKRAGKLAALPPKEAAELASILASDEPAALRRVAALRLPTTYEGKPQTLGKALLLDQDWRGNIDLSNPADYGIFSAYITGK